jgi:hypothetical protein
MASTAEHKHGWRLSRWRFAAWAALAALLMVPPLVAMQFTDEVQWTVGDFVFVAVMLTLAAAVYELAARTGSIAYRAGAGVAIAGALLLIWVTGAVGIIGSEDDDANLMYGGVLLASLIGAAIARFRPEGLARAMVATALATALAGVIALAGRMGDYDPEWPRDVVGLTGFFVALWLASAWLFWRAGRERSSAGAA